ncbi:beta-lactamase family protein [candidate division KSB1 bacterium]|nr:beta-lactamase family protein [candidate division KSB1 bacterium]
MIFKKHFFPSLFLSGIFLLGFDANKTAQVDQLFSSYNGKDTPGAVVMAIKNGKPLFKKAYGSANLEEKIPTTLNTNFRLASVTKQFTAMCIMKLVQSGRLGYDHNLQQIFPEFPAYGQNITLRHLLQHTSGLVAYEELIPDTATVQVLDKDVLKTMMGQDSAYFPPGAQYRYSNSGYAVLAMVIEKISGKSFALFLQENIFKPLGMKNTVAYQKGISTVKHRAMGYRQEGGRFVFSDQSLTSAVLGDGGIYSSVEDLFEWDQALYTEKLVKQETLAAAFTPGVLSDGKVLDYGFGWQLDQFNGHRRVMHSGSTSGFRRDKITVIGRRPAFQRDNLLTFKGLLR